MNENLKMLIAQCIHDITMSHGLVISLFLAGLIGGVTHCVGMCSPFILAQTDGTPSIQKFSSSLLLPYHMGRMTTYMALAILVHSFVNLAFVFSGLKSVIAAPMLMLAGVMFVTSAFPKLSAFFPWSTRIQTIIPYKLISRLSGNLMKKQSILRRYSLGILLGFMPCGLVVSALLASATASNIVHAALAMGAFTLGTIPSLIVVALGGQAVKQKYPNASARITQGAMMISSLWLFVLAGIMVF